MFNYPEILILCGGLGTRLKPLTKKLPKPMVQINNKPFLQYLIEQCRQNGIKNFLLFQLFFDNYSCPLLLIQMLTQKFFHSLDNNRFNLIYMFNFSK